jgi:2-hydroxycyclohexanecarboxyl-CoA dehydrogenase
VKIDATRRSLERYGEPSEIAVAFLAGPQARFVNGQVLRVDGSHTLFPGRHNGSVMTPSELIQ